MPNVLFDRAYMHTVHTSRSTSPAQFTCSEVLSSAAAEGIAKRIFSCPRPHCRHMSGELHPICPVYSSTLDVKVAPPKKEPRPGGDYLYSSVCGPESLLDKIMDVSFLNCRYSIFTPGVPSFLYFVPPPVCLVSGARAGGRLLDAKRLPFRPTSLAGTSTRAP